MTDFDSPIVGGRKFPLFFYNSVKAIIGLHIIKKNLDTSQDCDANHGILYVANHVSWFDIICLGSILNARFIAKKEVASMGIFGLLSTLSNTVYIDNENKKWARERRRGCDFFQRSTHTHT